jgi:hypothetical protein
MQEIWSVEVNIIHGLTKISTQIIDDALFNLGQTQMESADPQSINSMRDTAGPYYIYAISDRRSINLPPKSHPIHPNPSL